MASYTPNLNLIKPADADSYDVANDNGNMDKIDAAYASLNSKITTSDSNPNIPSNSDLNNYRNPGAYTVPSDGVGATISNIPRQASGKLIVITRPSLSYITQFYVPSSSAQILYSRNYNDGTWTSWVELAHYEEGKWTPKLYDYTTYKRDLAEQTYYKIGSLYIMPVYLWNANYSGISTMIQFRNLPCTTLIAGTIFLQNLKSSSVGVGIGIGVQPSGNYAYVRANTTSSDFIDAVSSAATTMLLIGI